MRSAEHLAASSSIVVAWELCWYRYEVDLSEPAAEAQVIAQGTELAELAREDRLAQRRRRRVRRARARCPACDDSVMRPLAHSRAGSKHRRADDLLRGTQAAGR